MSAIANVVIGLRAFGQTKEAATASKVLAASRKILFVQALPAAIGLALVLFGR